MKKIILFLIIITSLVSCGIYSFSGVNIGNAESVQIDFFPNQAPLVEPNLSQTFTEGLRDLFTRQTNLSAVTSNGDLHFSGEITGYRINPMSASANQTAAQNRLTVTVNVRFVNKKNEKDDFERQFSFYSDVDATVQLTGGVLETALDEILERITQDIFNASVAKW
ncbi:MAG: LptE family protein [Polaribacter sp.]